MENQITLNDIKSIKNSLYESFSKNVIGQSELFETLLIGMFSSSHILLESVPGLAKTRAAMVLAKSISGKYSRIQFTPDLMPSDIVGNKIYNIQNNSFTTQVGPIYGNVILADEINRAPAKVQSALLEAMQEKQISLGGDTIKLPDPFFVIATQNPIEQEGTYSLPEAQLDRFLIKEVVNYPSYADEKIMLDKLQQSSEIQVSATVSLDQIIAAREYINNISIEGVLKEYIVNIIDATRNGKARKIPYCEYLEFGSSPRGSIAFMKAGQVKAALAGRDYVTPDDIKALRYKVLRHRMILSFEAETQGILPEHVIDSIFNSIPTP